MLRSRFAHALLTLAHALLTLAHALLTLCSRFAHALLTLAEVPFESFRFLSGPYEELLTLRTLCSRFVRGVYSRSLRDENRPHQV